MSVAFANRPVDRVSSRPANRPSIVGRAAIARGFDQAIRRNLAQISKEQREQAAAGDRDSQAFREFAQQVALATSGPCLRYSQRLNLIGLAERGGINRFDANLIIAAIQHRTKKPISRSSAKSASQLSRRISSRTILLSVALSVQIAIVAGAWLALRG